MFLLHYKRKAEVLDVEREVLAVEDAQHINLLNDALYTALELTDTLLLLGILLDDMLENLT